MEYLIKICLALILFASCADDNPWLDLNKNNIQKEYLLRQISVFFISCHHNCEEKESSNNIPF